MRVLNRKDFLAQPPNTLYSKYEQGGNIGPMCIKYGSMKNDWVYIMLGSVNSDDTDDNRNLLDVIGDLDEGSSIPFGDDETARDGMFNEEEVFLVYDTNDVIAISKLLQDILKSKL